MRARGRRRARLHLRARDLREPHEPPHRVRDPQEGEPPKLVMGRMQMEGELVKLKKPLAIMSLVKPEDGSTEYHAAGVVRSKVVFKTRPVPVITKSSSAAGSSLVGTKRTRAVTPEKAV